MPKLPSLTPHKIIKVLEKKGFILDRVKESHHIYYNPQTKRRVIVALHKKNFLIKSIPAALIIDQFIGEGLNFVSFGTNDLTQYTLAVDRNNEHMAQLYNELHPAIMKLIQ